MKTPPIMSPQEWDAFAGWELLVPKKLRARCAGVCQAPPDAVDGGGEE